MRKIMDTCLPPLLLLGEENALFYTTDIVIFYLQLGRTIHQFVTVYCIKRVEYKAVRQQTSDTNYNVSEQQLDPKAVAQSLAYNPYGWLASLSCGLGLLMAYGGQPRLTSTNKKINNSNQHSHINLSRMSNPTLKILMTLFVNQHQKSIHSPTTSLYLLSD